ncbi:glycosyltransferase family protein [Litchfieldia salsa]|nr:glycosyltransferase [Litchfieldia salsa]
MWIHGLPNGFSDLGHEVLVSGPLTEGRIKEILSFFQPELIITMGHTKEHTKEKQDWLRKYIQPLQIPHIYWATEDPGYTFTFTLPYIETVRPDFVFTICQSRVPFYKERGIKAAHLDFGYHSSINFPTINHSFYEAALAVIANGYPMLYEKKPDHFRFGALNTLISPFLVNDMRIDFWGRYWEDMGHIIGKNIPDEWIHGYVSYEEANKIYSSAKIILGVQNHTTQVTQRTFEVLGAGGLLLTNDTPEVRRLFNPGHDLLVTSSPKETIILVQEYLKNPKELAKIRENGIKSVSKYSYTERARYMIDTLVNESILSSEKANRDGKGKTTLFIDLLKESFDLHKIEPGDTLWAISRNYNVSIDYLKRLNELTTDLIEEDDYLKIREKD